MGIESTGDHDFGHRLTELRKARELSQEDVAKKVGVQPGLISHFETGRRSPSLLVLKKLADALGTSMDYLTGRRDDPALKDAAELGNSVVARINRTVKSLSPNQQEMVEQMIEGLKPKEKL